MSPPYYRHGLLQMAERESSERHRPNRFQDTFSYGKRCVVLASWRSHRPRRRARATNWGLPGLDQQFVPELRALAVRYASTAEALLRARQQRIVAVHGTTRVAVVVASALAAAGIGQVRLSIGGDVHAADACPGGLGPSDEGRPYFQSAVEAVRRAAPRAHTAMIGIGPAADLVILTEPGPVESSVRSGLHVDGCAHLVATSEANCAVIGPLVLPGSTSCLRCGDLHRTDRDPAWPALAVQLTGSRGARRSSDVALSIAAAGVATTQALAFLDGQRPSSIDATLEWELPDWRLRRRSWTAHHRCDCGAAAQTTPTRQNGRVIMR